MLMVLGISVFSIHFSSYNVDDSTIEDLGGNVTKIQANMEVLKSEAENEGSNAFVKFVEDNPLAAAYKSFKKLQAFNEIREEMMLIIEKQLSWIPEPVRIGAVVMLALISVILIVSFIRGYGLN
jgi:hypothetical protein